jgi:hypothetical protein
MGLTLMDLFMGWVIGKALDHLAVKFGPDGKPKPPDRKPRPQAPASSRRTPVVTTSTSTPPWPQVVPAGLPPFPGAGWVPDEPPPPAVVARAHALLGPLWSGGPGTFKVEQTAGRWIAYRATPMSEGKKGVVAFRESSHASFLTPPGGSGRPTVTPEGPVQTASVRPPSPTSAAPSSAPRVSTALPTLRRGAKGEDVRIAQRALGVAADGDFGPATEAATIRYQRAHGLTPDGVIGPQTWGALLGRAA